MAPAPLPLTGQCRCGKVAVRVTAPPLMTAACHCRGCQVMTSSAFSLTAMIPTEGFEVIRGGVVVGGARNPETTHYFCADCMTWMFTRPTGMDMFVNLRATVLDDARWFTPYIETMTRDRLPWATTPAVQSYEGFPPPEDFAELMAGYAAG